MGWGGEGEVWVNPLEKENFGGKYISDNVEWTCKKFKKNDICWYKSWCKTRNKRSTEISSQNFKDNVKQACIFHLILAGIPFNLILSGKIRGGKVGFT